MRTPDFLNVDERKLTEWMRDTLLELKRNPNRVHWFDLFHDDVEGREYAVVMGVNDDYEDGSGATAKVAYAPDNRIIMDYDDFEMPYDPETGEVDDTDTTIAMLDDVTKDNVADFVNKNEVKWLLDAAEQFYKEYKEKEPRMEESRRPRSRMLREEDEDGLRSVEDYIEELEVLRFHSKNLTQKQYTLMIELTAFLKKLSQKMKG